MGSYNAEWGLASRGDLGSDETHPLTEIVKTDTTGFSRVVLQNITSRRAAGLGIFLDTTDFSRVEFSISTYFIVEEVEPEQPHD